MRRDLSGVVLVSHTSLAVALSFPANNPDTGTPNGITATQGNYNLIKKFVTSSGQNIDESIDENAKILILNY